MHARSVKVFIWCSCNANAVVMCRPVFPTDDSTEGTILCSFFTSTRSRGQAADYCCMNPEHMPAGYSLAAPFSKDLGYWCGTVGCSPHSGLNLTLCGTRSSTPWSASQVDDFFFVKVVPTESSKVQE